jgi:4-hydroxybenzoate polyprenyltransferase
MQLARIYLQRQQPALTIERAVDEFQVMLESRKAEKPADVLPLVVDLDGVLIRSNMLAEMVFGFVGRFPFEVFKLPVWLWNGKSVFKHRLAELSDIDAATLPYDESVLCRIRQAREQGRPVYLASACDERLVQAVADHLGGFDGWFASDETTDLSAEARDAKLVDAFGADGFDYIGNDRARVAATENAGAAIAVDAPPPRAWRALLRLLRPHQWAKNALVGVALLTAHQFTPAAALLALLAAVAFSACAAAAYVFNDFVDIRADREHPTKRNRPLARGDVSFTAAAILASLCLVLGFLVAAAISVEFLGVLALYLALTMAYSLVLKRKLLIDVVTLAGLYTIRVVAGAVAIEVPMSEWLLTFSMFIFLSLALVKRYSELAIRYDEGLPDPVNRNYKVDDLPVVFALAAASGYCAAIVLALYLSSETVRALYTHPSVLWLACPLFIYWISRTLMLSHRRVLRDDPIVFAMRDKVSWMTAMSIVFIGFLAA